MRKKKLDKDWEKHFKHVFSLAKKPVTVNFQDKDYIFGDFDEKYLSPTIFRNGFACIGCGECISRCQMEALSLIDEVAVPDLNRCIGCGLCVTACDTGSLYLVRKPQEEQPKVPTSLARAYMNLAKARGKMKRRDVARLALRSVKGKLQAKE